MGRIIQRIGFIVPPSCQMTGVAALSILDPANGERSSRRKTASLSPTAGVDLARAVARMPAAESHRPPCPIKQKGPEIRRALNAQMMGKDQNLLFSS